MSPKTLVVFENGGGANKSMVYQLGKLIAELKDINTVWGYKPFIKGAKPPSSFEKDAEGNARGFAPAQGLSATARKAILIAQACQKLNVLWTFELKGKTLGPKGIAIVTIGQVKLEAKQEHTLT
jgi:hypothetical protein